MSKRGLLPKVKVLLPTPNIEIGTSFFPAVKIWISAKNKGVKSKNWMCCHLVCFSSSPFLFLETLVSSFATRCQGSSLDFREEEYQNCMFQRTVFCQCRTPISVFFHFNHKYVATLLLGAQMWELEAKISSLFLLYVANGGKVTPLFTFFGKKIQIPHGGKKDVPITMMWPVDRM